MANGRWGFGPGWLVLLAFITPSPALPATPADDPVTAWVARLRSPDLKVRLAAGYALDNLGPDPTAAARSLIAALGDPDPFVRAHAAAAVGEHQASPEVSVPALIAALSDPDEAVSAQAAVALGRIGGPAVPALVDLLKHPEGPRPVGALAPKRFRAAEYAVFAMGRIGAPALSPLVEAYRGPTAPGPARPAGADDDPARAALKAAILEAAPRAGRLGIAPLMALLDDPRPGARALALEALEAMGPDAEPASARLIGWLKVSPVVGPPEARVWYESVEVHRLARILSGLGEIALPPLLAMSRSDDPTIRKRASMVLGRLPAPGPASIAALAERLDDADESVRYFALGGLGFHGPKAVEALPGLIRAIGEEPAGGGAALIAGQAVDALDRVAVGPSPELTRALPRLLDLARSPVARSRGQAMRMMGLLGPAEAERTRPALLAGLDDAEADVRYRAALALWKLGEPGPEVARRLVGLLDVPPGPAGGQRPRLMFAGPGQFNRRSYVREVANLGETAREAVPAWVRLLAVGDLSDQSEAIRALARVRPEGVSALIELASDGGRPAILRAQALLALAGVPRPDDRIAAGLPAMLALTRDAAGKLDAQAVGLIARLGPDDPGVEAAVSAGLRDPDPIVRAGMAGVALRLGPGPARRLAPDVFRLLKGDDVYVRLSIWNSMRSTASLGDETVPILASFLLDESADTRKRAAQVLARLGAAEARSQLWAAMEDRRDPSAQAEAARALVDLDAGLGELDPATLTIIQDRAAVQSINDRLREVVMDIRLALTGSGGGGQPSGGGTSSSSPQAGLPPFPWPSPPASTGKMGVSGRDFPREWLGKDDEPLSAINDRLFRALRKADPNFDSRLFGVPDGFAMLAQMERIGEDGTPVPAPYHFITGPIPPLSLSDYIARLFVEQPGHFRVIAFVVTSVRPKEPGKAPLPALDRGALELTGDVKDLPFRGRNCYVLVYTFQKRPGGLVILQKEDGLNARTHLIRAGILTP